MIGLNSLLIKCSPTLKSQQPTVLASESPLLKDSSSARFLQLFQTAEPKLIAERSLLRRVDTQYALSADALLLLLEDLGGDFKVVMGTSYSPFTPCQIEYFDTADKALYRSHTVGLCPSYLVCVRNYPASARAHLEFTVRVSQSRNHTTRFERETAQVGLKQIDHKRAAMITGLKENSLTTSGVVQYLRMTLVSVHHTERITIDTQMTVKNRDAFVSFGPECVLEVKQARESTSTPIMQKLREHNHHPIDLNKYCCALQTTDEEFKQNAHKNY